MEVSTLVLTSGEIFYCTRPAQISTNLYSTGVIQRWVIFQVYIFLLPALAAIPRVFFKKREKNEIIWNWTNWQDINDLNPLTTKNYNFLTYV